jgi:hypothetical protein
MFGVNSSCLCIRGILCLAWNDGIIVTWFTSNGHACGPKNSPKRIRNFESFMLGFADA